MILQPFTVTSGGIAYDFVDSASLSSATERELIQQLMLVQLEVMQDDAKCEALGIGPCGTIPNLGFGVYVGGALSGTFLVAALAYQSGPWADLVDWEVTDPNARAVFHARPMPAFPLLTLEDSLTLSVDSAHHLLTDAMTTVDGHGVGFARLSWAVHKERSDPGSRAVQRVHERAAADARFTMAEALDPDDATLTRVDIELA